MDPSQFLLPQEPTTAFDSLPIGIYIINAMGTVLYVNSAMARLSGVPRDIFFGASIFAGTPYAGSVTRRVLESKQTVTATNQNLRKLCTDGHFRENLFYLLNVVPIHLPPLRQRREDIIPLIQFFLNKYIQLYGRVVHFSPDAPMSERTMSPFFSRAAMFSGVVSFSR